MGARRHRTNDTTIATRAVFDDLVPAADPVAVCYYSWDDDNAKWTRHTISATGENIALGRQMAIGDLNKDGRNDIVATSRLGLWIFINQGYNL
jgi:hypothetical protein